MYCLVGFGLVWYGMVCYGMDVMSVSMYVHVCVVCMYVCYVVYVCYVRMYGRLL